MSEKPILFSDALVRAILAGTKTQTRRLVTARGFHPFEGDLDDDGWPMAPTKSTGCLARLPAPGMPGDRLYVRECFALWDKDTRAELRNGTPDARLDLPAVYRADFPGQGPLDVGGAHRSWRPSIHMPRWASRLTLEVTGVRVERVQDISEEDARAEGFEPIVFSTHGRGTEVSATARERFEATWRALYGYENWSANPWCWVVEFKRIEAQSRAA